MTQIVSTQASSLQGAWHPSHTPASQSALHPLLTDDMFLLDLLQKLVSLLALDSATFLTVFSPLAPPSKEAACTRLVSSEFSLCSVCTDGSEDQLGVSSSGRPPGHL